MDLISRQAAIDALNQIFDRCEEIEAHLPKGDPDRTGYKMYPDYMIVWKYLHQLPSAEPERKTGLVDRKEVIKAFTEMDHMGLGERDIIHEFETMPSVDAIPVVRCKDCKYWNPKHAYCEGVGNWFGMVDEWSENGFCYKGERRTDADN